jgi:hypothetical protein
MSSAPYMGVKTIQSAASATGNGQTVNMKGYTGLTLQIDGTFVATVSFEGTIDGSFWFAVGMMGTSDTTIITNSTVNGVWRLMTDVRISAFRARVSAYTSGNVTVKVLKQ